MSQELHRRYEGTPESIKTKALQTVIDMKVSCPVCVRVCVSVCPVCVRECVLSPLSPGQDAKLMSMERGLRELEEELLKLKSSGLSCEERQEEMKQMELYRSHTKFMKSKVRGDSTPAALPGQRGV